LLTALRILPTYRRFHERTGYGAPAALQALVEQLWQDIVGRQPMTEGEVRAAVDRAMELVPSEEDIWDEESQPYAEDAAAALAYAFRTRLTGDPQEAIWAARRVYEAADHFALGTCGIAPGGRENEHAILAHPSVQAELARQKRDLEDLSELARAEMRDSRMLLEMRERSEGEAESFFEVDPPNGTSGSSVPVT
jgi:uncharacterized protein YjaG (DUF416 family)